MARAPTARLLDLVGELPSAKELADHVVPMPEAHASHASAEGCAPLAGSTQCILVKHLQDLDVMLNRVSELERSQHNPVLFDHDESLGLSSSHATSRWYASDSGSGSVGPPAPTASLPLRQLSVPELQQRYEDVFGAPSGVSDNAWLIRRLEEAERGLSPSSSARFGARAPPGAAPAKRRARPRPAKPQAARAPALSVATAAASPVGSASHGASPRTATAPTPTSAAAPALPSTPTKARAGALVAAAATPRARKPAGGTAPPPPGDAAHADASTPPPPVPRADGKRRPRPTVRYAETEAVAAASAPSPRAGSLRKRHAPPPAEADAEDGRRRKHHHPWSLEEAEALVAGVEACGGGKWADIKKMGHAAISSRSSVDLKDKWRNLLRIARLPDGPAPDRRRELPSGLLERVRALANMEAGGEESRKLAASSSTTRLAGGAAKKQRTKA